MLPVSAPWVAKSVAGSGSDRVKSAAPCAASQFQVPLLPLFADELHTLLNNTTTKKKEKNSLKILHIKFLSVETFNWEML